MKISRNIILFAILLFAAIPLYGSSAIVSVHNANYSDIDALIYDFTHKPITKSNCKEYSICAEELKHSATNRIDCEYAIRFKDFVDFLSGNNPNARFYYGEFSQLEDMLNLSITTLYEDSIVSILEFEVNGISVRALHNKTQTKWIRVSITSHKDSPFSSNISEVGAMEDMYVLYDDTLESKSFLPITEVKIISMTDGLND